MNAKLAETRARETPVDLNDVALLVRVVQAASFSAAAKDHGVPVSTVSRRIARLEARLGTRLLERTTRTLRLTDVGRSYFAHAERALDELAQGNQQVRALHAVPRGKVRITAPVGLGPILTVTLASYLAKTPLVSLDLDLTDRRVDLIADEVDVALRVDPTDSADFVARKILESTRHLFASPAYLDLRGRPKELSDLSSHDLIATRVSASGAVWELFGASGAEGGKRKPRRGRDRADPRHRFAFKPRLVVNELMTAKQGAISGMGIALLPAHECVENVARGELERVLPRLAAARGGLWLVYRAHRSLTAAVRSCVDHLLVSLPEAKLRGR